MSRRQEWIWMPHAGHLIVGHMCRFKLNTCVGGFIVSTVGEYVPDSAVRQIIWESRRPGQPLPRGDDGEYVFLKDLGYEEIGFGRTYETMVFRAVKTEDACCPWRMSGSELEMDGYSDANAAAAGHMRLCAKWSRRRP